MNDELDMHYGATGKIFEYARILRTNMTGSEKVIWKSISKKQLLGLKFRRQHPIGNYIADFYCHERKLVIEIDGKYHENKYQKMHDNYRDSEMERFGINIIRFKNDEIFNELEKVLHKIQKIISLNNHI